MTSASPATYKEVAAAIAKLGITASQSALMSVSETCRAEFLMRLNECLRNNDHDGKNRKYLEFLLRCFEPVTIEKIRNVVPGLTIDAVAGTAKKSPTRLITALDTALNHESPRHQEAIDYLRTIGPKPEGELPSPPPTEAESPSAECEEILDSSGRSLRMEEAPSSSRPNKHESYHVYGTSFALCFNATTWDETPGVMVDAASAQGPRSYDWRNAIHLWLTPVEVAATIAVFRRWRTDVSITGHGSQNDKSFTLAFQKTHFFARVCAKVGTDGARAVKISPTDAAAVAILFLHQLQAAYQGIPLTELLETVRATHQTDYGN